MAMKLVIEVHTHFVFAEGTETVKKAARELCDQFNFIPAKFNNTKRMVINNPSEWKPIQECMQEGINKGHLRGRKVKGEIKYEYFNGSNYRSLLTVIRFQGC